MDENLIKITSYSEDGKLTKEREISIDDLKNIQKNLNHHFINYHQLKVIYLNIEKEEMKLCFDEQVNEVLFQDEREDYYIIKAPLNILNEIKKILHR